ncbi:MAG: DNA-nicking Smr family endonuclease [Myxococcota bacterium]
MSDEDQFARLMEQSGVIPLGDRRDVKARREEALERIVAVESTAEEEFEAAMGALDRVLDKDSQKSRVEPRKVSRIRFKPRERVHIDRTEDLHGMREHQALIRVAAFIPKAYAESCHLVALIVGKGLHSKDGVSILRPAVENWLRLDGETFVEEYGDAPNSRGGSGVILVKLRSKPK